MNLIKPTLRVVSTFSGVGFQDRGCQNATCFNYEFVGTCEMDINAIISFAAINNGMTNEMVKNYIYPSRQEMAEDLKRMNIGYDFKKEKPYDWDKQARGKKDLINKVWLACKLNKNFGDITKVEEFPDCDVFTYSSPCFVEGTLVFTSNGYKEIQDVEVGEYVLTHTNKWQKVVKTMTNEAESLCVINCMPSEKIYCTPNHPFYVRLRHRRHNPETHCSERIFDDPQWVEAKELHKDFYVGTAINQIEKVPDYEGFDVKKQWGHENHVDSLKQLMWRKEFWYIIGRYIGDGWTRNDGGIVICGNQEEYIQILDYLDKLGWNYNAIAERTVVKIYIPFQEIGLYCEQFGKGAANKHLTSDILNLPCDLLESFLDGYLDSDGCFTQNKYKITSVSRRLIYDVAQCIMKVYHRHVPVYFCKRKHTAVIEGRTVNQRDTYTLTFQKHANGKEEAFYEDGYIWSPIRDVNFEKNNSLVYNLEVENDNSYQIQNVIVHNCTDYSLAGNQEGTKITCKDCGGTYNPLDYDVADRYTCPHCGSKNISSTRSGLLAEVERILLNMINNGKHPKFLIQENVDALVNKKFKPDFDKWCERLDSLGYNTYWKVLNTKWTGIPQNRSRVYAVSIRKDIDNGTFEFPKEFDNGMRLKHILEEDVDDKYYIKSEKAMQLINELVVTGKIDNMIFLPAGTPLEISADSMEELNIINMEIENNGEINARA